MKPSCVHSVPAGALGDGVVVEDKSGTAEVGLDEEELEDIVVEEDELGGTLLVGLGAEVIGDSVVEDDVLCGPDVVGLSEDDEIVDSVVGLCSMGVADVVELTIIVGEALDEFGFCVGVVCVVSGVCTASTVENIVVV